MTTRVLVCFNMTASALQRMKEIPDFSVDVISPEGSDNLSDIISKYDALAASENTVIDSEVINNAKELKVISLAGIGLDNIDLEIATSRGILVMNTPKAHTITTAEHTISMIMALSRKIPQATASMKAGMWEKKKFMGTEVYNKVLGIIGFGNIGRVVGERGLSFGMRVIASDLFIKKEILSLTGVRMVDMDTLLKESDFITIHTPKTERTINLIDRSAMEKMKSGVKIINCAGGGIVSESDLVWAIGEGIVSGAALDVFETEPPTNLELLGNEKIILTPHLGGFTEESYEKISETVIDQIRGYFENQTIDNAVNFPSMSPETLSSVAPFLELGEKLGDFLGQVIESEKIKEIEIAYLGLVSNMDVSNISLHMLKSFLSRISMRKINPVNALTVTREFGIKFIEEKSSSSLDYSSEIRLRVVRDGVERLLIGAIVGNRPRIVRMDDYIVETIPEGDILLVSNYDLPGVVGSIGTSLGEASVNIGRMQLARDSEKKKNLILINLDSPVEESIIKKLAGLPNVIEVKQVTL